MYDNDDIFFDKHSHIRLDDGIHVIKNFVSEKECEELLSILNNLDDSKWHGSKKGPRYFLQKDHRAYGIDLLLSNLGQRYSKIFDDKYKIDGPGSIAKMDKGAVCGLHPDNAELIDYNWVWTCVAYITDFDGGEIHYPKRNITYKAEKGDLLFHRPDWEYEHEVLESLSDGRIVLSSYIRTFNFNYQDH